MFQLAVQLMVDLNNPNDIIVDKNHRQEAVQYDKISHIRNTFSLAVKSHSPVTICPGISGFSGCPFCSSAHRAQLTINFIITKK